MTRYTYTPSFSHLLWPPARDLTSTAARNVPSSDPKVWVIIAVSLIIGLHILGAIIVKLYRCVKRNGVGRVDVEQGTSCAQQK